jgi:hypothetical protein
LGDISVVGISYGLGADTAQPVQVIVAEVFGFIALGIGAACQIAFVNENKIWGKLPRRCGIAVKSNVFFEIRNCLKV